MTGISRGVGYEIASRFLAEGAQIIGVARDADRLARAVRVLDPAGRALVPVVADLATDGFEAAIVEVVRSRWGALDILINNAAVMLDRDAPGVLSGPPGALERTLTINLMGPYRLTAQLLPYLEQGHEPRVIHVSSGAGTLEAMKTTGIASYRLSKWALNGMTMLMAAELAGRVAVNAFDPGWVRTDMGGPQAPGTPAESAEGALTLATAPFEETGKFWKDGKEIPY